MSKAIKLTKTDLAYLKFGGASSCRTQIEAVRVQHTSIAESLSEIIFFGDQPNQLLFVGHDATLFSPEQLSTLSILESAAKEVGCRIDMRRPSVTKNVGMSFLLTNDKPLTYDDLFDSPSLSTKELVHVRKRKGNA